MIEALWSVKFVSGEESFGSGIVVMETGRIFGGDSLYYYLGDYTLKDTSVYGAVEVIHYFGPRWNIFGEIERLNLKFDGIIEGDIIQAHAKDPGNPQRTLTMQLRRLAILP